MQITPGGTQSLFAQINPATLPGPCPGGVGLTTALAVLPRGYVVVGSLPTSNGMAATAKAGCLIVLDSKGQVVETISGAPINGPWDLTAVTTGHEHHAVRHQCAQRHRRVGRNADRSGHRRAHRAAHRRGTSRPWSPEQVIANGFPERTDPAALVVGPTGSASAIEGTLYVADTQGNRIAAVPNALFRAAPLGGGGITVAKGGYLNGPLGLTHRAERRHPRGQRRRREHRRDDALRRRVPAVRNRRRRRRAVRVDGLQGRPGVYFVNDSENTLDLLH